MYQLQRQCLTLKCFFKLLNLIYYLYMLHFFHSFFNQLIMIVSIPLKLMSLKFNARPKKISLHVT